MYNTCPTIADPGPEKCRRSRRWDSNPRRCDCLSQPSSTQPTAPQEYSGGEADRVWPGAYHTIPPFFHFWVVPVRLGPPPLPALTPDHSPPRPPILARLDPHTPHAWSALALNRGPPGLPIVVRLGPRFWPALTCYGRPLRNSKQE